MSTEKEKTAEEIAVQLLNSKAWCDADMTPSLEAHLPLITRALRDYGARVLLDKMAEIERKDRALGVMSEALKAIASDKFILGEYIGNAVLGTNEESISQIALTQADEILGKGK